ncbi:MAG: phosphate/phosphite/phosphonate ABC transporter substrate-binding protein [Bdellovibrionia bacterium]
MIKIFFIVLTSVSLLSACTQRATLGSEKNPIKVALVPGQDTLILEKNGKLLEAWLEKQTGYKFEVKVPVSFIAVVESLGSSRADIAFMNTFGFLVAQEKFGAKVRLIGLNQGADQYHGQIISHVDGPKSVKEIQGKKFAYVDPASTSGYVLAVKAMMDEEVKPKEYVFAGRHDNVVMMVYQKRVDAGATFHSNSVDGQPRDARRLLAKQFPDVFEKIRVLKMTGPVPNDPVVFRKGIPLEMEDKIVQAIKDYFKDPQGKEVMYNLYHMDGVRDASDQDYVHVKKMLLELGKTAQEFTK